MRHSLAMTVASLLTLSGVAGAVDPAYQQPLKSYQAEIGKEELLPHNSNYFGTLATSQAKRAVMRGLRGIDGGLLSIDDLDARRIDSGGDIDIASPEILGDVRGDINIVIERGAIRGKVISVKRR